MNPVTTSMLDRFEPIDLASLNRCARLQTRKDRKYIVSATALNAMLDDVPPTARALEIDGRRWFGYRSVYFDTPGHDSYRLTATRRPHRFKVRTRSYVDSDLVVAEVKTKNRRGRTVKNRHTLDVDTADTNDAIRQFASRFTETAHYAADLQPALISEYQRATLALPSDGVRVTIDAAYRCTDATGRAAGLEREFIVETKTDGTPSIVDHLLWSAGHRPQKISKFATGLAALNPDLPANRWNRVLRAHFTEPGPEPAKASPRTDNLRHNRLEGAVK